MDNVYGFNTSECRKFRNDLFVAYYDCRRNKRNTANALRFEVNFEDNIHELWRDVLEGRYEIGRSCAFIVHKPVKREIFAADFRDRVIHHYIIAKLEAFFERMFIYDSYSCRKDKGTHFAVKRMEHFMRSCSDNYTRDCYVLKLDIQGFFMSVRKEILYHKVEKVIEKYYRGFDKQLLKNLSEKVIMNNPVPHCVIKGSRNDWDGLPESKSLFRSGGHIGLPIGNLTSQMFANLYLNDFDHYVKRELKVKYYGRYVDDCAFMAESKGALRQIIKQIRSYLQSSLGLTIHPRKIYLQHYTKGLTFTGIIIKPHRQYIGKRICRSMNRVFRNDYRAIYSENEEDFKKNGERWLASVNSYLGIGRHYDSYRFRKKLCDMVADNPIGIRFNESYCVVKQEE
ncbi:RNA-directed DNA polymerase [Dysgonomonas sp. 25]|uniref:RNA-directed DNA polymerase n=1 Tax=Dysgonomonas sp. 25 TaxID=2302933 RepID=UPI0013D12F90|nr:RNA-directed DNA polymerase [Dysgonomonas sp. 25]NDV70291.1 RNA-directed DNA polymerase [Dysgonomonas sp. 25]